MKIIQLRGQPGHPRRDEPAWKRNVAPNYEVFNLISSHNAQITRGKFQKNWPSVWAVPWPDGSQDSQTRIFKAGRENRTRTEVKLRTMKLAQLAAECFQNGPMRLGHN